jgi:hypothetical protein
MTPTRAQVVLPGSHHTCHGSRYASWSSWVAETTEGKTAWEANEEIGLAAFLL